MRGSPPAPLPPKSGHLPALGAWPWISVGGFNRNPLLFSSASTRQKLRAGLLEWAGEAGRARRDCGPGRALAAVGKENQGNVSRQKQKQRSPSTTKAVKQPTRGGGRGLWKVQTLGQSADSEDPGALNVRQSGGEHSTKEPFPEGGRKAGRPLGHLIQRPAGSLDAVLHSQAMQYVRGPPHKGPRDSAPFPRQLVQDASMIRKSLRTTSRCLGNETCFLWRDQGWQTAGSLSLQM